jgi:hypothetical protein
MIDKEPNLFAANLLRKLGALTTPALLLLTPGLVTAAGGGAVEGIVLVADSRRYSGVWAWFSNLYNDSAVLFTVVTIVAIPLTGALLGIAADFVMSRVGIDLTKRSVAEH